MEENRYRNLNIMKIRNNGNVGTALRIVSMMQEARTIFYYLDYFNIKILTRNLSSDVTNKKLLLFTDFFSSFFKGM